jgi:AcrR family transcriptional regulator
MTPDSPSAKARYHHGNLVEALLQATIALIEEKGVDALSVREVARRAQVSPAAPFRHFSNKRALLTAVAEQAMTRLTMAVEDTLPKADGNDPIACLRAIGRAYLTWVQANPTHFQIISSRSLIDFRGSELLVSQNEAIRLTMVGLVARARAEGRLAPMPASDDDVVFAARAFIYGVARMWNDGHFPEWNITQAPPMAMEGALELFIGLLGAAPGNQTAT